MGDPEMAPQRIRLSRARGWRMPLNTVKVSRGTIWGNPFRVGKPSGYLFQDGGDSTPLIAALSQEQAAALYADMMRGFLSPEMHPHGHKWMSRFREKMRGAHPTEAARWCLRGKNLACWCPPGSPCHADVLLEIANAD